MPATAAQHTPDPTPRVPGQPRAFTFRRRDRIGRADDYRAVFDAQTRKRSGPITVFARPNGLDHHRLGLSIGRRVGNAVTRNRIKRRLREAFRLHRHTWHNDWHNDDRETAHHTGYDFVVTCRAHRTMPASDYAEALDECARKLISTWSRRDNRRAQ